METIDSLKYPYTFENRTPTFLEGVLFVPDFFDDEGQRHHQRFQDEAYFKLLEAKPIYIEYCSGNGQWLCAMAKKHPDIFWIGCELKYERVKKIYKRIKAEKITNCMIAFGSAETFTKYYLPQSCLASVFVNFPDPWPKKKHAKHRLFQVSFLKDLFCVMKQDAQVCLATDEMSYLEQAMFELQASGFKPILDTPFYRLLPKDYGYSFFEDLWTLKGKQNYQTLFYKP